MENFLVDFIDTAKLTDKYSLCKCSSGNMSVRIEDNMYISGTGTWLCEITDDMISKVNIITGKQLNNVKPSMEYYFHRSIFINRPDVNNILHFQSEYATVVSCMENPPLNFNVIIEIPAYVKTPAFIPYLRPGSKELASMVGDTIKEHDIIIMKNHGQIVVGSSYKDIIKKAVFFELACKILLTGGNNIKTLNKKQIKDINEYIR